MLTYSAESLLALRGHAGVPPRAARKTIFSCRLWRPRFQRQHDARRDSGFFHSPLIDANALSIGCVNACSVNNKSAVLCSVLAEKRLDFFLITETWHETSDSVSLKRVMCRRCETAAGRQEPTHDAACKPRRSGAGLSRLHQGCYAATRRCSNYFRVSVRLRVCWQQQSPTAGDIQTWQSACHVCFL